MQYSSILKSILIMLPMSCNMALSASGQSPDQSEVYPHITHILATDSSATENDHTPVADSIHTTPTYIPALIDSPDFAEIISCPTRQYTDASTLLIIPPIFHTYELLDSVTLDIPSHQGFESALTWLDDYNFSHKLAMQTRQRYMIDNPQLVRFNTAQLPSTPKSYRAYIDPSTTKLVVEEIKISGSDHASDLEADVELRRWLHNFNASLQFSQAFISPNWYQGGNNSLNMIGQVAYNVKLNPKIYTNLLFETTVSYKLALNSAPDDSIHAINISEDIFQINSTFGLKAARHWYYSANLLFKTQLCNSYPTNQHSLRSSFLSPGELNVGVGMTYNIANAKKTFDLGLSISPLSWNLKTCTDHRLNPTAFGIDNGRRTLNKFGSSAELKLKWNIAYNILYSTRLFAFTDYEKAQADWEHTIDFNINRFLSTRFYVNMRYDTTTPTVENSKWHKFQLKEILSFGITYHFES